MIANGFDEARSKMTSLRELLAQQDNEASSPNVRNLEKRVELQRRALDQAEEDLRVARAKQGAPVSTPAVIDAQAVAAFVMRADRRRRGLEALDAPAAQPLAEPPTTPQGAA